MVTAYYNEIDPKAAAWLRELISAGVIANGVVDTRSICDVDPRDLVGFQQCHFFAGIGVWSYALRQAGVPDDYPVWTGSCPCQPFSVAGKGLGVDDDRHLWPVFHDLIGQRRPAVLFGEQVASAAGRNWLSAVRADLEALGYAVGAADLCAAGVGAPHIRQRLYFTGRLADAHRERRGEAWGSLPGERSRVGCPSDRMANTPDVGRSQSSDGRGADGFAAERGQDGGMADADGRNPRKEREQREWDDGLSSGSNVAGARIRVPRASGQRGIGYATHAPDLQWRTPDWLFCRDGKWRPVEPGTFPLAHGAAARVGRLRGYGNAIVAPLAQAFIESSMEAFECISSI